jgi:hypothetical protein
VTWQAEFTLRSGARMIFGVRAPDRASAAYKILPFLLPLGASVSHISLVPLGDPPQRQRAALVVQEAESVIAALA